MDEAFWSNVVKRWADASESVIKLKEELATLQKQKAEYTNYSEGTHLGHIYHGRPQSVRFRNVEEITPHPELPTIRDELKDAEAGIGRAKEEYRRLQSELAVSVERIQALSRDKEQLCFKHAEETLELQNIIQTLRASRHEHICAHCSLKDANDGSTPAKVSNSMAQGKEYSRILALEQKVETLSLAVEARDADNESLRSQLASARDKLFKSEANQKLLLKSINKLQEITRTSLDHSLLHSDMSRKSLRLSVSSNGGSLRAVEPKEGSKRSKPSSNSTAVPHHENVKENEVVQYRPIGNRAVMIDNLPKTTRPNIKQSDNMFERDFLKCALGEGVQTLLSYFSDPHKADMNSLTSSYLCPTLNHHPWCPSTPGQHGFIFVGFGKDKNAYNVPVIRNLFVGHSKKLSSKRVFSYLGKYQVSRVDALTVDEWMALPHDMQAILAKLYKDKENDSRPVDDLLLAFHDGQLAVPCVQLQFISFDQTLHTALASWKKERSGPLPVANRAAQLLL